MTVTALGIFSGPIDSMRELLASLEAFQQWVGVAAGDVGQAAGVAQALARTHRFFLEEDRRTQDLATRKALRPFVAVRHGPRLHSDGRSNSGTVAVYFQRVFDETFTEAEDLILFGNELETIRAGLFGSAGELRATELEIIAPPAIEPESGKDALVAVGCVLGIGWQGFGIG